MTMYSPLTPNLTMFKKVTDSGIDTDMMSDTTSVNSRNYEFKYRDGRRYVYSRDMELIRDIMVLTMHCTHYRTMLRKSIG
jgi:hypothetical protein